MITPSTNANRESVPARRYVLTAYPQGLVIQANRARLSAGYQKVLCGFQQHSMKSNKLTLGLCIAALMVTAACASFEKNSYRTVGSIDTGVDLAMKTWAKYVATGKATDAGQAAVRASYERYKVATKSFDAAIVAYKKALVDNPNQQPDQIPVQSAIDDMVYKSANLDEQLKFYLPPETAKTVNIKTK